MRSIACIALTLAALSAKPGVLLAQQPSSDDRALASVLFEQGRALMAEGKAEEACPKLEESQRLDPGGGTLLNLALCHEAIGRTATAWGELVEARGIARRDGRQDRIDLAQERLDALALKLSFLIVHVPAESVVPGLEVSRDGSALAAGAWDVKAPVDPGSHEIVAVAPGFVRWSQRLEITAEPATREITVPRLQAPPPPAPPPPFFPPVVPPPVRDDARGLAPLSLAGIGVGSVGLVSISAGAISAGIAAMRRSESEDIDPTCDPGCSQDAVDLNDEAKLAADVATGTIIGGAALGGAGLIMLLVGLDQRAEPKAQALEIGPTGATFKLRF